MKQLIGVIALKYPYLKRNHGESKKKAGLRESRTTWEKVTRFRLVKDVTQSNLQSTPPQGNPRLKDLISMDFYL